jgi:16S rRNA (uracil1498-N3)-methyltransferase
LVERDDRAPLSTFFADTPFFVNATATLGEHVAHHARVKRLEVGDAVQLTNGAGSLARGSIAAMKEGSVDVTIDSVRSIASPLEIHLRAPIADRDRMLLLAEKATELGIASWQSVRFKRSMSVSPRGEGAAFAEKLRARMVAALEQSGGAWLPRMLDEATLSSVDAASGEIPIVLDASGDSVPAVLAARARLAPMILVGPEGGIEPNEMAKLVDAGWKRMRLAHNTLRFETAGIAAIAAIRSTHNGEDH